MQVIADRFDRTWGKHTHTHTRNTKYSVEKEIDKFIFAFAGVRTSSVLDMYIAEQKSTQRERNT